MRPWYISLFVDLIGILAYIGTDLVLIKNMAHYGSSTGYLNCSSNQIKRLPFVLLNFNITLVLSSFLIELCVCELNLNLTRQLVDVIPFLGNNSRS